MDSAQNDVAQPGFLRNQIVQTSADTMKAPKNIISNVQGAKAIFFQYKAEHLRRIDLYAAIEGLIAGNPPYNPNELARYKLSHISNFNNLDARALYERGALAYWNLLNEAETLCKFTIRGQEPELVEWAEKMSEHWSNVVRSWPSFDVVYNIMAGQIVKFGVSPIVWPDERDWRWRPVELARFYVEDQAQTDIRLLTCICVETIFTAQFLWEVYDKFKDVPPKDCPWNLEELTRLMVFLANQFAKTDFTFYDMMDIQRRIQNGDLTFNAIFTDSIRIVSLLYKEYDGKVSHYMFHPYYDAGDFLYFSDRQYSSLEDAVIIFTASPGEFTIHSNRGLGHKIFSGSQAMMQLDCSIIDMARMSATPLIQSPVGGNKDFEQIRFYPGVPTNLGAAEFVENTLGANISQLITASQYVLSKIQFNTANSGDDPSMPDKSTGSISPSQARMQSYKEFSVLKNNIAHFYTQFDRVLRNMVVKMLNSKKGDPGYDYVKEWKQRCIDDGVPDVVFNMTNLDQFGMPRRLDVRATRVAGDGSTLARIMGLQELLPISAGFGPREEHAYKREWIIATMGPEYVPVFLQDTEEDNGDSLAGVENAIMMSGVSPVFSPDNQNRAHFGTHMALGNDTIRKIQQQNLTALNADTIFSVLIPHMGEHWKTLVNNIFAKTFVEQMKKAWDQLQQYATLNRHNAAKELQANIRKQQELQQKQQGAMSDEERKDFQAQKSEQRADFKVKSQVARADEANKTRADVMREKVQLDAGNNRLKVQLDKQNEPLDQQNQDIVNTPLPELKQDLNTLNGNTVAPYDIES